MKIAQIIILATLAMAPTMVAGQQVVDGVNLTDKPISAQEGCDYASAVGSEIQFAEESEWTGWSLFQYTPDITGERVPHEKLAGKKAKIKSIKSDESLAMPFKGGTSREVIVEDCSIIYYYDLDSFLDKSDEGAIFEFIEIPKAFWTTVEKKDVMTDIKSCAVNVKGNMPYPQIRFYDTGEVIVLVFTSDYDGSPVTFRIDKKKAITERDYLSGANARLLISQIRAGGKSMLVQANNWSNSYFRTVTHEYNLDGAIEKIDYCINAVKK